VSNAPLSCRAVGDREDMNLEDMKQKCLEEVLEISKQNKMTAECMAYEAVKLFNDDFKSEGFQEAVRRARFWVIKNEERTKFREEIVNCIHKHWPRENK